MCCNVYRFQYQTAIMRIAITVRTLAVSDRVTGKKRYFYQLFAHLTRTFESSICFVISFLLTVFRRLVTRPANVDTHRTSAHTIGETLSRSQHPCWSCDCGETD